MDDSHHLTHLLSFVIDDLVRLFLPTGAAFVALHVPIVLVCACHRFVSKVPAWALIAPLLIYLLTLPACSLFRSAPALNMCVASMAIYYAQKVCEWMLVRRDEFQQWSFWDVHHELFYYRVYTQPVTLTKLQGKRKEIFFSGPIQFDRHAHSVMCISVNVVFYYLFFDASIWLMTEAFSAVDRAKRYRKHLVVQILVNHLGGCVLYSFLMLNYEMLRHTLCFLLNRPLELIPDLFRQPYRATSPMDFWARWHQIFKNTWVELIFKPTSARLRRQYPRLPRTAVRAISTLCVFIFSGLVHEYPVYIVWNRLSGSQMQFFVCQGLAVIAEHALRHRFPRAYVPKPAGWALTFVFNGITAGYFLQPWMAYFEQKHLSQYSLIHTLLRLRFNR